MRPCTIVGNVGNAPELRYTPNGAPVTNFSLALYAGKSQEGDVLTTWVRCTAWKDLAEIVNSRVGKGDKIQVEGYLQEVNVYTKGTGEPGYSIQLTAFSVKALKFAAIDLLTTNTPVTATEEPDTEIPAPEPATDQPHTETQEPEPGDLPFA